MVHSSHPRKSFTWIRNLSLLISAIVASMLLILPVVHQDVLVSDVDVADQTSIQCLEIQLSDKVNDQYKPTPVESNKCLLYEAPTPYIELVMKMAVGAPNQGRCGDFNNCKTYLPYEHELRQYGNDWPPFGYTMIGLTRLENFRAAILEVNRNHISGSIVELGVWRGGAMITAAAVCQDAGVSRDLYVFDAFEVIPNYASHSEFLANSMKDVQSNFDLFGVNGGNVHFVKGLFKDSIPAFKDNKDPVAVLRVDGNFYDSYQDAMYYMYEKVPVGGIVIFDDVMSHKAVMTFWNDFKADQGIDVELNRIDKHSAWFRKEQKVKLDFSKMHPPQDANQ